MSSPLEMSLISPVVPKEQAKGKIERMRSTPLGRMIIMDGVGENIQSFFSFSTYLPICSLFAAARRHLLPSKEMRSCLFIGNRFSKALLKSIETIRLFRWYVWLMKMLKFSKKGMICYVVLHIDSVSKTDLNFYLFWRCGAAGRRGKDWRLLKKGVVKDKMDYYYICMTVWAEYFGYVSFDSVPFNHRNIYLSIRYGMWDRADMYIRRGDGDGYWGDIISSLNHDDLRRLVRTHDLQDSLFLTPNYYNNVVEVLLYEGIILKRVIDRWGYDDIVQDPQKGRRIPMNVVEDFFVVYVRDVRERKSPWQDICDATMKIVTIFFNLLQRGGKKDEKISSVPRRRLYPDEDIDEIISILRREGDTSKQRDMAIIALTLYISGRITERRLQNIDPLLVGGRGR